MNEYIDPHITRPPGVTTQAQHKRWEDQQRNTAKAKQEDRALTHIKAIVETMKEDSEQLPPVPAGLFVSGMLTGLATAIEILKGGSAEQAMEQIVQRMDASIGRAYMEGKLPAPPSGSTAATDGTDPAGEQKHAAEQAEAERDGAYRERAHLVALLAAMTDNAVIAPAPDVDEPGWQIAYLQLGGWQASWHISPRDADLFKNVEHVPADDPRAQWDGHTTAEKYAHIATLTAELAQRCGPACAEGHTYTGRCEGAHAEQTDDSALDAPDVCSSVDVGGETVRVHGRGDLGPEGKAALIEETKRKHAQEQGETGTVVSLDDQHPADGPLSYADLCSAYTIATNRADQAETKIAHLRILANRLTDPRHQGQPGIPAVVAGTWILETITRDAQAGTEETEDLEPVESPLRDQVTAAVARVLGPHRGRDWGLLGCIPNVSEAVTAVVQPLADQLRDAQTAIGRARALASRWAVLRTHGSAATDLRAALDGKAAGPARTTPDIPATSSSTTDNPLRDRVAKAILGASSDVDIWPDTDEHSRDVVRTEAEAALAELQPELDRLRDAEAAVIRAHEWADGLDQTTYGVPSGSEHPVAAAVRQHLNYDPRKEH